MVSLALKKKQKKTSRWVRAELPEPTGTDPNRQTDRHIPLRTVEKTPCDLRVIKPVTEKLH